MASETLPGGTCHLSMGGPVTAPLGDVSLLRVALGRRGQAAALLGTPMGTPLGLDSALWEAESCYHRDTPCDPACRGEIKWPWIPGRHPWTPAVSSRFSGVLGLALDYSSNGSDWCQVAPPCSFHTVVFCASTLVLYVERNLEQLERP